MMSKNLKETYQSSKWTDKFTVGVAQKVMIKIIFTDEVKKLFLY